MCCMGKDAESDRLEKVECPTSVEKFRHGRIDADLKNQNTVVSM